MCEKVVVRCPKNKKHFESIFKLKPGHTKKEFEALFKEDQDKCHICGAELVFD